MKAEGGARNSANPRVCVHPGCAFLFTVLGEWWAEGKKVDRSKSLSFPFLLCLRRPTPGLRGRGTA